jgi:N-acetyltransferase
MDFDFAKDIQLENERVLIRPLLASDLENLLEVATQDETLVQYSPYLIHSEEYLKVFIQDAIDNRANKTHYSFIIFDKKAQAYAGSTSFWNISNFDKRLEIGRTWIGKDFQATGLNRNCKFLLLEYVFDVLEFERVELKTDQRNQQSRNAIQKIGGQFEGIMRSHTLMTDGFRRSTVVFSILKNEWATLKHNFPNKTPSV